MANGGALVHHDDARLLQLRNDRPRAVAGGLDHLDALIDDGLCVRAVVGRVERGQQRNVDAEGVLGQGPALLDLLAQVGGRGEDQRRDDAQAAGVGDGGGELSVADVLGREVSAGGLSQRKDETWAACGSQGEGGRKERILGSVLQARTIIPPCTTGTTHKSVTTHATRIAIPTHF